MDKRALSACAVPCLPRAGGAGTLEGWSLRQLLTWLRRARRSADIRLEVGLRTAKISVLHGTVRRARYRGLRDREALAALLDRARCAHFALDEVAMLGDG